MLNLFHPSPKGTPPNVTLAEVFMAGCLGDEPFDLLTYLEALLNKIVIMETMQYSTHTHLCVKIFSCKFVSNSLYYV